MTIPASFLPHINSRTPRRCMSEHQLEGNPHRCIRSQCTKSRAPLSRKIRIRSEQIIRVSMDSHKQSVPNARCLRRLTMSASQNATSGNGDTIRTNGHAQLELHIRSDFGLDARRDPLMATNTSGLLPFQSKKDKTHGSTWKPSPPTDGRRGKDLREQLALARGGSRKPGHGRLGVRGGVGSQPCYRRSTNRAKRSVSRASESGVRVDWQGVVAIG